MGSGPPCGRAGWHRNCHGHGIHLSGATGRGGTPVNGDCDFRFRLLDAQIGGTQVGPTQDTEDVTVTGGLHNPEPDFGSGIFTGEARWLEVAVSCAQGVVHTTVGLPQQLTQPLTRSTPPHILRQHSPLERPDRRTRKLRR